MSRIARYRKVIQTFVKYGFEDLVAERSLKNFLKPKRRPRKTDSRTRPERVRLLLEELGPTYVKLGQLLSNRRDILPPDWIRELEHLQDEVPPLPFEAMQKLLKEELMGEEEQYFRFIEKEALASASIAQVHRAELYNGERVVLKMQRPGIRKTIKEDFAIIRDVAGLLVRNIKELEHYQPFRLIDSFEEALLEELNFKREAININRFKENFKDDDRLYVPKVYQKLSTQRLVCMEEIKGTKISDIQQLKERQPDTFDNLARVGTDLYFRQIFEHGFFHADPHPGNLYVLNDGRLCFLDFGIMGTLLPQEQDDLAELIIHMARKNINRIAHTLQKMAITASIPDKRAFERDLHEMLEMFATVSLTDFPLSERIQRFKNILVENTIELSPNYYLLMRAMVILEGVAEHLDPGYNAFGNLQRYSKELFLKRYNPKNMASRSWEMLEDGALFIRDLPADAKSIINKMKEGRFQMEFKHQNLEGLYQTFDVVSNRISVAILVAALIIGSSLIVLANIPPYVFDNVPIIGFIGFVISGLLGLWLVISILRSRDF
jgi:ubiquinone biosynthesis protein